MEMPTGAISGGGSSHDSCMLGRVLVLDEFFLFRVSIQATIPPVFSNHSYCNVPFGTPVDHQVILYRIEVNWGTIRRILMGDGNGVFDPTLAIRKIDDMPDSACDDGWHLSFVASTKLISRAILKLEKLIKKLSSSPGSWRKHGNDVVFAIYDSIGSLAKGRAEIGGCGV
ncbi:hypothetical protein Tco_0134664 [Tanacetum coccineum]